VAQEKDCCCVVGQVESATRCFCVSRGEKVPPEALRGLDKDETRPIHGGSEEAGLHIPHGVRDVDGGHRCSVLLGRRNHSPNEIGRDKRAGTIVDKHAITAGPRQSSLGRIGAPLSSADRVQWHRSGGEFGETLFVSRADDDDDLVDGMGGGERSNAVRNEGSPGERGPHLALRSAEPAARSGSEDDSRYAHGNLSPAPSGRRTLSGGRFRPR